MFVSDILTEKGGLVYTVTPSTTVGDISRQLSTRRIGSVLVVDRLDQVAGIVSERDIVRAVATAGAGSLAQPVSSCMTIDVLFAEPGETVDSLLTRMTDRRIRHLPVCLNERLVGIVSIGDLVKSKISEVEAEADAVKAYIAAG